MSWLFEVGSNGVKGGDDCFQVIYVDAPAKSSHSGPICLKINQIDLDLSIYKNVSQIIFNTIKASKSVLYIIAFMHLIRKLLFRLLLPIIAMNAINYFF